MSSSARALAASLLVLAGCGTKYEAAIRLTIAGTDASALGDGGGYYIDLTLADGERMRGVERTFVEFHPGDQEVTVVLQDDAHFDGDKLRARLRVEAVASKSALPEAVGVAVVTLERGAVVDVTVNLRLDPRPVSGDLTATFGSAETALDGRRVVLAWDDLVAPADYSLHAGLHWPNGAYQWLGELETGFTGSATFVAAALPNGPLYLDASVEVIITAENAQASGPLSGPGEWTVFRGAIHSDVRTALEPLLSTTGELADVITIYRPVLEHAGLARGAIPNVADTQTHCEHVYVAVNGDSPTDAGDLNGNGMEEFIVPSDTGGMVAHLQSVRTAISNLSESSPDGISRGPDGITARGCADAAISQVAAIQSAAEALASDVASTAKGDALVTAVTDFWGAPFFQGQPQTFECLVDRVEAHTVFAVPALAKGAL